MKEARCASPKWSGRSCGRKILFSPRLPVSVAVGSWWGVYREGGIIEPDCKIDSTYLESCVLDRHHLIVQWNTHQTLPAVFLSHSFQDFQDWCNLCGSSWLCTRSHPLILCRYTSMQNRSLLPIPCRHCKRCGYLLALDSLPSSSAISPYWYGMEHSIAGRLACWYDVFHCQSGKLYPWFHTPPPNIHIFPI